MATVPATDGGAAATAGAEATTITDYHHGSTEKNVDGDFMATTECVISCNLNDLCWTRDHSPPLFCTPHSKNPMDG
jgi:hypothetical protein